MTHQMSTLDPSGDTTMNWDASLPDEVEPARAHFTAMRKKGYLAYRLDRDGNRGEVIREFNPEHERIMLTPPLAGG